MSFRLFVPYLIFIVLGLTILLLPFAIGARSNKLQSKLAVAAMGLSILVMAGNRVLYLKTAFDIVKEQEPQKKMLQPVVFPAGYVYMSIEDLGDFRLDRWHNVIDDESKELLGDSSRRPGLVFIDPSDNLPVAVELDTKRFLLEGTARTPSLASSYYANQLIANSETSKKALRCLPNIGMPGWLALLEIILLWYGVVAFEYVKANQVRSAIDFLVFIPSALVYFSPFIVGSKKHCRGGSMNFCLNLFLGWTILGWLFVWYRVYQDLKSRSN